MKGNFLLAEQQQQQQQGFEQQGQVQYQTMPQYATSG